MEAIESLLRQFEGDSVSPQAITDLIENVGTPWFDGIFNGWINRRLRERIDPNNLLNYIKYSLKMLELRTLGDQINEILIGNVCLRKANHEYFFYVLKNDPRSGGHDLLYRAIKAINYLNIEDGLYLLRGISENTSYNYHDLVLNLLEAKTEARSLSNMLTMSKLPIEDQYEVLALSCLKSSAIFKDLVLAFEGKLAIFAANKAHHGPCKLVNALLHTKFGIQVLEERNQLTDFLLRVGWHVPHLIRHLMERAEKEERWIYILKLAPVFNKRDVLRILLKAKDPILIDKFFFLFKDYSEVKNLTPFL